MRLLLVLLLGLLASLAVSEIAVRVLDVSPRPLAPLELHSYRLSDDPVLRYEYRPGLRADEAHFDALHEGFTTNSQGFRDVEFPVAKPAGELRILALGDSTTAGNGVPELENTWPKRLERRFAEAGRPELRVLNLGVGGYQPLQEARLLELRGLALEPDLVLVLISLNDLDCEADGGIGQMLEQATGGGRARVTGPAGAADALLAARVRGRASRACPRPRAAAAGGGPQRRARARARQPARRGPEPARAAPA